MAKASVVEDENGLRKSREDVCSEQGREVRCEKTVSDQEINDVGSEGDGNCSQGSQDNWILSVTQISILTNQGTADFGFCMLSSRSTCNDSFL